MASRFPRLKELSSEATVDKNETINLEKANEVHDAVVSARDEDEPIINNGTIVFGMIAEKLHHFPLNSARCKKTYDKYFKKTQGAEASGEKPKAEKQELAVKGLEVYERIREQIQGYFDVDYDQIFKNLVVASEELAKHETHADRSKSMINEPMTPTHRSNRHKQSAAITTYAIEVIQRPGNTQEKPQKLKDELKMDYLPSAHFVGHDVRRVLAGARIEDFFHKRLEAYKNQQESGGSGESQRETEKKADKITFGENSGDDFKLDQFAVPHLEKSISYVVNLKELSPYEEKDIPLLRAFSEQANSGLADLPTNKGGFSLVKSNNTLKGFGTPGNDRPASETSKVQIQSGFSHFGRRNSESKWNPHGEDIKRNLDLSLGGQHSET